MRGATARRWFFDRVLDGNVQYPVLPVLLKPYLSRFCALRYEGVPEVFLLGVDTERYPEVRSPSRSGNPPRELVVAFFGVVKLRGLVREPYRVAVVQLFCVVRLAEFRDVVTESGFGLIRQVVGRHDVAHRRHGTCPRVERLLQTVTVRFEQVVQFRLLVRRGWRERRLQRFRDGRRHATAPLRTS